MQKTPQDLLRETADIISERGQNYGGIENNFQLAADLASLRLGRLMHPYEVAVIMCCVKNARAFASPDHLDSHLDASAYELFAATFAADYALTTPSDVTYKRKTDLKPSTVKGIHDNSYTPARSPASLRGAAVTAVTPHLVAAGQETERPADQ